MSDETFGILLIIDTYIYFYFISIELNRKKKERKELHHALAQ
jgi:preprotein translocase subunit YajC